MALLTPRSLFPLDFGFHFSGTAPPGARQTQPRRLRRYPARRLKAAAPLTNLELAQVVAQDLPALYLSLEEETGRLTFLERRRHYLPALLRRIFGTLTTFYTNSHSNGY